MNCYPTDNVSSCGHAVDWKQWLGHLAGKSGVRGLEVGSNEGKSAVWFLDNILNGLASNLKCIDTWKGGEDLPESKDDEMLKVFIKNTEVHHVKIRRMRGRSEDVLPCLRDLHDFAYIDGSHTAQSVLSDSVLVWRLVKPGGIVIWDDYLWEVPHDPVKEPKMAIDSFLACYHGHYKLIAHGWQICVKKIS